jgi:DNA polymerase III subunit chi
VSVDCSRVGILQQSAISRQRLHEMTEILFYHLNGQTPEQVLPALLQKSLERGWRVVVQASSEERVEALDAHLWTWRDDAFLPHGIWRDSEASAQPILLTAGGENPNGAVVRFLVDGAAMPANASAYQRVVVLFDGADSDAVVAARVRWSEAKSAGFEVTYWQADEKGGWRRQA